MKTFYRVSNIETGQGLWYSSEGGFTGLIHDKFDFCVNSELKMDFDKDLCGYLSAADSLDSLWQWFSKEDIKKLQEHGYYIHEYEAKDFEWYERFEHWIINQDTSVLSKRIILL